MPRSPVPIDIARRNRLAERHLSLVAPLARHIQECLPPCFELDDLIAEGQIGLLDAAARYAPDKHGGTPFVVWARIKIKRAIQTSVRRRQYRDATHQPLLHPETLVTPAAAIEEDIDARRRRARVQAAVIELPPRERRVVELVYGDTPLPGEKIVAAGKLLQMGKTRTLELRNDALARLRQKLA